MATLRLKAAVLLTCAKSIEDENYYDDVTAEEQLLLEEVVRAVKAAGNLLMLHVNILDRIDGVVEPIDKPVKRKLKVVK